MTTDLFRDWIKTVYNKRRGAFFHPPSLLTLDQAPAHPKEAVESSTQNTKVIIQTIYINKRVGKITYKLS